MNGSTSSNAVLDFFSFLRRPSAERIVASLRSKLGVVGIIIALDILFGFVGNLLSSALEGLVGLQPEHVTETELESELMFFMRTIGILVIPFIEEVGFRLWLAPNLLFLFISFAVVTIQFAPVPFASLLKNAGLEAIAPGVKIGFYLLLGAAIVLFFWLRERKGHRYADFFNRHVGFYFYLSVIAFGLVHLTNYTDAGPWWYGPILVLPQLVGGLAFGYLRIRLGFWYAVLAHMLANLIYTLGDGMNALFGEVGGVVWLALMLITAGVAVGLTLRRKPTSPQRISPQVDH
ncbi:MAG: CPBP family glutamic-type intramembrane protease [Anaerolineales bacterium]|nr:CPBP family glutamic-type intramembrane protease [Anaerolineales bacterium]MCS7249207.1 CPBP family glutamic-type intramembrane protease [Anaerolineales bacterium]MDW8163020.1 CPBP family glutamic-type intramembrane protease [Anaerolineales bacterium]MDW8446176.1 CPBP family glutamic-type intramembrane protease [Anaerolineales bacterium]